MQKLFPHTNTVFFDPIFKRIREVKHNWKIKKDAKEALEKSILKSKNNNDGRKNI